MRAMQWVNAVDALNALYVGDQHQESVVTDDDEEYDDSYSDEDTTMGSPTGEADV